MSAHEGAGWSLLFPQSGQLPGDVARLPKCLILLLRYGHLFDEERLVELGKLLLEVGVVEEENALQFEVLMT